MAEPLRLPPPNRNRLLPISIALLSGRNPRIRGFGWGRDGVGGRAVGFLSCHISRPPPPTPPHKGRAIADEQRGRRRSLVSKQRGSFFGLPIDYRGVPARCRSRFCV